ncbi:MAG: class I SAM-dependent methyltransferase [Xanthobacteraceae bacterium]
MSIHSQKGYWEKRILDWEKTAFAESAPEPRSLVERIATRFRGTVRHRPRLAMVVLEAIRPASVLELGCGSGRFSRAIADLPWVERVTGVDISEEAIEFARQQAGARTAQQTYLASSVAVLDFATLPPFDFVVGLGLTPYLLDNEFDDLLRAMNGRGFFLDFHPKGFTFDNVAHGIYRAIAGHPFYHRYSIAEFRMLLSRFGYSDVIFGTSENVWFACHAGADHKAKTSSVKNALGGIPRLQLF